MTTMKWEELTAKAFPGALKRARGVCVVPMGCLEKHGGHLPVGTDLFQVRAVAEAAVAIEPAVIFPPYYLTQIQCGKHYPGAVALSGQLITDLLNGVCDEIARNGFHKIVLLNGHGGNEFWLTYSAWMMAHERDRDFTVYLARLGDFWSEKKTPRYTQLKESKLDGHGGESETSLMMALRPDLVKMTDLEKAGAPLRRLGHLLGYTPHWWYADYPRHYAGDGSYGTKAKGEAKLSDCAQNVADILRAVKRDTVAPRLRKEFFKKVRHKQASR